jgi:tetraacyldisaccharide 4'-kinase
VSHGSRTVRSLDYVWYGTGAGPALLRLALTPVAFGFAAASAAWHTAYAIGLRRGRALSVPVLSVGNLTVGGTGKTPFSRWLVGALRARHRRPAVLHGGYGGDEPELHRLWHPDVPIVVDRDRLTAGLRALEAGADVLILDDGMQHRRMHRDLDIVLVSAEQWQKPRRLLPRGPWRERPRALARADVVVVTRRTVDADTARAVGAELQTYTDAPVTGMAMLPGQWLVDREPVPPPSGPAVLVTSVAEWQPVAVHAQSAGAQIGEALVFPDHHEFDVADIGRIRAATAERALVCTEKDWVKLRRAPDIRRPHVLTVRMAFEYGGAALDDALDAALGRPSGPAGGR